MGRLTGRKRAADAPGRRLSAAAAAAGFAETGFAETLRRLHSRLPGPRWAQGTAVVSVVGVVALGVVSLGGQLIPRSPDSQAATLRPGGLGVADGTQIRVGPGAGASGASQAAWQATGTDQARYYRRILIPDLLIVAPKGLTSADRARLAAIHGVRNMISFDGAQITAGGRSVNVIGVDPASFRSWVPLRTASSQPFWTQLSDGEFVAAQSTARHLKLKPGDTYQLTGGSSQVVRYGSAAQIRLAGIDLLVNESLSRKLVLVHQVAALISAPGVAVSTLTRAVTAVLGPTVRTESLVSQQLPVGSDSATGVPSTYLQLFKESAARYCPGLSWTVLAAIGQIESADGTNEGPSSAGALGPMQFEPGTWARWGIDGFGQTGTPNIMNPYDAVPSAARLLCLDGAASGGQSLFNAIYDYNHADWYVREVLGLAAGYAREYG